MKRGAQRTKKTETTMGLDYYEILSLQRTATTADVQKAYRKLGKTVLPCDNRSSDVLSEPPVR